MENIQRIQLVNSATIEFPVFGRFTSIAAGCEEALSKTPTKNIVEFLQ